MPLGPADHNAAEASSLELDRDHAHALSALGERVKELRFMYEVANAARVQRSIPELVAEIVEKIPPAFQRPEVTTARIALDPEYWTSPGFREGAARIASEIHAGGRRRGRVEVYCLDTRTIPAEGAFLHEERTLLDWLAQSIGEAIEHREADDELRQHREQLENLVETRTRALEIARHALDRAGEAAFWVDPDGSLFDVNEQACRLLDYSREELLRSNVRDLLKDFGTETVRERFDEIAAVGGSRIAERVAIAKGGRSLSVEMITTVSDFHGRRFALSLVRDVTERNRAAAELAETKAAAEAANRAKSAFLAHMSHEIRTPMNAVLGFAQLLQRDPAIQGEQREQVVAILRSGEHLLDIINDVLEMSKIEAGHVAIEVANFDVRVLVSDLERMFRERARQKGLVFNVEAVATVPAYALGDQGKIRQIVVNLVGNAIKFTKIGRVELRVQSAAREKGRVELRFEVEDTGPGIAEEELDLLFREFHQGAAGRSKPGTGLGLAISRRYARLMGGDVTVVSRLAIGSRFTATVEVELGRAEGVRMSVAPRRITSLAPAPHTPSVIVADDHTDSRVFLRDLFAKVGFRVSEAKNGVEALSLIERKAPDLLLLDINMPEMNGVELLKRLRQRPDGRNIRVIAVSASILDDTEKASVAVRADASVRKPVDATEILELAGALLGVRYLSEGGDSSSAEPESLGPSLLSRVRETVPDDARRQIREAAERADASRLRSLLAGLELGNPALASDLARLVDAFDYDALLALAADNEVRRP